MLVLCDICVWQAVISNNDGNFSTQC